MQHRTSAARCNGHYQQNVMNLVYRSVSALQSHLFLHKSKILQYVTPNNKGGPNRTFDLWSSVTDDATSHILIDGATHVAFYKQVLLSTSEETQSKFFCNKCYTHNPIISKALRPLLGCIAVLRM